MYHYIIVGAGSAGCVLANRLTQDPAVNVLLLEAGGPDSQREINIPAAFSKLFQTACDWNYYTNAEPHLENRKLYWPRGKVLGGSSSINAMIYIRGNRKDYDRWSELGNPGWSFAEVLPYFKRSQNQERGPSDYHGFGGPLNISDLRTVNPLSLAFVEAAVETGFPRNSDFNAASQEGFGPYQVTQRNGSRHSAAAAFLRPVMNRPNLTVLTHVHAGGVLFEGRRAVGISFHQEGAIRQERAEREIILCAGAVNSPQLLMLSGVGPAATLRQFRIPVVMDLPGVGQNLQDHPSVGIVYECLEPVSLKNAESISSLVRYLFFKNGSLTSNIAEAGGFIKMSSSSPTPEIQFHFGPGYFKNHGLEKINGHAYAFGPTLVRPQSIGSLSLRSSNPLDAPRIQANYFSEPRDLEAIVEGLKIARRIGSARAFAKYRGRELFPGESVQTDATFRDYARRNVETLYHPAGSCKMGPGSDPEAVVDAELRVHGVEGLRVVDASIMPIVSGGNTNAPTIMIAEKAADLIKGGLPEEQSAQSLHPAEKSGDLVMG